MSRTKEKIDPITFEVIRGGLVSLCWEMGIAMEKSAYSPIFSEGLDYSYAMFDGTAEMIAQAAFDPCHLGAMPYSVRASVEEIGLENLQPGDILLENDPYNGGSHISDFTTVMPIFHKGEIVAMPAARGHQIDVGAIVPGGMAGEAEDIFQEGLRIPPIRVNAKVSEDDDIWKIILANVRLPHALQGDLRAMFGALRVGERRIAQYVEKYGVATWNNCLAEIKNVSERYMREEIQRIPSGSYEYEDYVDDSGKDSTPAKIHIKVDVRGGELVADYSGSSPQVPGPINAAFAVTAGNTVIGVLHSVEVGGDYVLNQGTFRPITIKAPKGTIVNPNFPAPVQGGNTELSNRIVDTVIGALAQATDSVRIKASCHGTDSGITVSGLDPDTREQYINYLWSLGGQGARAVGDGNSAMVPFATNNKGPYIEINEVRFPIIHEEYAFVTDSAGPGKHRGGMGTRLAWRLSGDNCELSSLSERHRISPYGVFGGFPPMPRECGHFSDTRLRVNGNPKFAHATELFHKLSPSKWSNIKIRRGDVVELLLSGGGGWGSPIERDTEAVLDDVLNGFVSIEGAKHHYGVVLAPEKMSVDIEETRRVRREIETKGPTVENGSMVEIIQTVLFRGKGSKATMDGLPSRLLLSANETSNGLLVRLRADNPAELLIEAKRLREELGLEPEILTTQFVPRGFQVL